MLLFNNTNGDRKRLLPNNLQKEFLTSNIILALALPGYPYSQWAIFPARGH